MTGSMHSSSNKITFLLVCLLALLFLFSLMMGRLDIHFHELVQIFLAKFMNQDVPDHLVTKYTGFWLIRFPRTIMAVIIGTGLGISGAVYQALFRNPLVSPDILGVSAGCTFGAAIGLVLPGNSFMLVHLLAFFCGLAAVSLTVGIARLISFKPVIVLVLSGMVVLSLFNSFLMIVKYFSDPFEELPSIVFWIMGSLSRVTWQDVFTALPFTLAGVALFLVLRFRLNILSLGDIQAKSLGMNPSLFRLVLIVTSSVIVAVAVATCGQICWIGLIIPHMARTMVGPEHEKMLPVTALLGAVFMLGADGIARSVSAAEIPVGIITALIGAPVFGFLLYKNRGSGWL